MPIQSAKPEDVNALDNAIPPPTSKRIIIGVLIDLKLFEIVLKIVSALTLFLIPKKNAIEDPIIKMN